MKLRTLISVAAVFSLFSSVTPVAAAVPVVNTFTVSATAVSPVPVTAFTASDSDGSVVGYIITQTSTKPAASDSRWTATPWSSFTTTSIGALTLYAWAKDNANGVSNSRTAATNVVGTHNHTMAQVTGLTAALSGKADTAHNHDGVYQKKYANVIVVAMSGGDFMDPVVAAASILDSSSSNPYLVKIMPGVYNIGSNPLDVPSYVDVVGSGETVTTIVGSGSHVVSGSNYHSIRDVMIKNEGSGVGIRLWGSQVKITNVTVQTQGGTGIYSSDPEVRMDHLTVGGGIVLLTGYPSNPPIVLALPSHF